MDLVGLDNRGLAALTQSSLGGMRLQFLLRHVDELILVLLLRV